MAAGGDRSRHPSRSQTSGRKAARGDDRLVALAAAARLRAYAPYSRFRVGAAVLTGDGTVYTGCNIENASYPLSHCAERVAMHKAVSDGHRMILTVAVVADGAAPSMPCGACRQVMAEFGVRRVIVATPRGGRRVRTLGQLLAEPFRAELLPGHGRRPGGHARKA